MKVLVAGATGYLGRYVVRELNLRGHEVRALVRDPDKLGPVREYAHEVFRGEATDAATLAGACDGCDAVFSSLGLRAFTGNVTYEHVDYAANMNVLRCAEAADVRRFLFVSVFGGPEHRGQVPQIDARERVVDALRASTLPWTVVRPTGFFNDMAEFYEMARKGPVWIIGDGSSHINPICGADLATFVVDKLDDDDAVGCEFSVGGPEVMTGREVAHLALDVSRSSGSIHSIPPWLIGALGTVSAPLSPNFSNMMKFFGGMAGSEVVGERTGKYRLVDLYAHMARGGDATTLGMGLDEDEVDDEPPDEAPAIVSRQEWLHARRALLAQEKVFNKRRDTLNRKRRAMPWVRVEAPYRFETEQGVRTLAELFDGRSQLIVYHFMYGPDWEQGCPSCSFWADNFDGTQIHLAHRDITLLAVSRAPLEKLLAYRGRMGWSFPWVSSSGSQFNFDYGVSFTAEQMESGDMHYNYGTKKFPSAEAPGVSVFARDEAGDVFHTYSTYSRGLDMLNGAYHYMDLVPQGRDEDELPYSMAWLRRHDQYED